MARVLIILSPGFEEIEAVTSIDLLRRAEIEVVVAGLEFDFVTGAHGITIKTDIFIDEINVEEYDCLLLPGGQPGTDNLKRHPKVIQIVREFQTQKKWIAAICAAPTVLHKAGITKNRKVTSYPTEKNVFDSAEYLENNVVLDDKLITSRGVGTAIDFALQIIELFKGEETKNTLAERILWKS